MAPSFLNTWLENRTRKRVKKYTFSVPEIGWTVQIPPIFELFSAKAVEAKRKKGKEKMEQLTQIELSEMGSRSVFYAQYDRVHLMTASIYSVAGKSDFEKYTIDRQCKEAFLKALHALRPDTTLDNHITKEELGGITFEDFQVTTRIGDKVLFRRHLYSAEINGYSISISILYQDARMKEKMIASLKNSKFTPLPTSPGSPHFE